MSICGQVLLILLFVICFNYNYCQSENGYECGEVEFSNSATKEQWPWKVAIFLMDNAVKILQCGGTLISKAYVLTTAECIALPNEKIKYHPKSLLLYLGPVKTINSHKYKVSSITIHDKYEPGQDRNFLYNIALLRLERPAQLSKFINPICLWNEPLPNDDVSKFSGKVGTLGAWTTTAEKNLEFQVIRMPIVSKTKCLQEHPLDNYLLKDGSSFCAGYNNGTGFCTGQSGAGLAFTRTNNEKVFQLLGIASHRHTFCGNSDYMVFVNVYHYLEWIHLVMSEGSVTSNLPEEELVTDGPIESPDLPEPPKEQTSGLGATMECGKVPSKFKLQAAPLIRNGLSTTIAEWPWHMAIYRLTGPDLTYSCGGSLLSQNFVLTAAHCITEPLSTNPIGLDQMQLHLGVNKLRELKNDIQVHYPDKLSVHPSYNETTFFNDIGLIKLHGEVKFGPNVRPICLWSQEDSFDISTLNGKYGVVVGWGLNENNQISNQLRKAYFPVIPLTTCLLSDRPFFSTFLHENNFCSGYLNGTGACTGDSGSGMFFEKDEVWQIRGIVSVGAVPTGSDRCHIAHYILITDVAKYLDWINMHLYDPR